MKTVSAGSCVPLNDMHHNLIEACKKGDQKAQFQVYKLYYKAMFRISLNIVNDPMEAEDIMQEAFLAAFEQIGTFSGTVTFGAWLKRIVLNRSIDSIRRSRRIAFEEIESLYDMAEVSPEQLQQKCEPDPRLKHIPEAVKRLSDSLRQIFSLYFFEGYDHSEISEILSISESTSRAQLSRARLKLVSDLNSK